MYRDVIPCADCMYYKVKIEKFKNAYDVYECTYWNHTVEGCDYCSQAKKAYPCKYCKHCKPLSGSRDTYLCTRGSVVCYTSLDSSCAYYEAGFDAIINAERKEEKEEL